MKLKPPDTVTVLLLAIAILAQFMGDSGSILSPTKGPREIVIVREQDDQTPEQSIVFTQLRRGPVADAIKSAGHSLSIYDDEDIGGSGAPIPVLDKFKPWLGHGELVILAPPDKLLYRGPVPATADAVLAKVKEHGG